MTGIETIVGIDEVGRGSWAGPVVAAAVVLSDNKLKLKDSKLLSKNQREGLAQLIRKSALAIGVGWSSNKVVDEEGLTIAVAGAMRQALSQIDCQFDQIIIDGHYNFLPEQPKAITLIKADQTIPSVSAASIIAKVERDQFMVTQAKKFPGYGFDRHVGYGTKLHKTSLLDLGPCSIHRLSYKPILRLINI